MVRDGDAMTVSAGNAARYAPYVQALERVDAKQLPACTCASIVVPEGVRGAGYPKAYFNDRLVALIDDLLAAPEPLAPLRLTQPKVLYEFEDAEAGSALAGRKAMLRLGPDNAQRVKAKLARCAPRSPSARRGRDGAVSRTAPRR